MRVPITRSRTTVRLLALAVIVLAGTHLALASGTPQPVSTLAEQQSQVPVDERVRIAPPSSGITVLSGQGFGDEADDALLALGPDGKLVYYEDVHDEYQDVDPSPEGDRTVLVVASDYIDSETCGATVRCVRDTVTRINLSTGNREVIYEFVAPRRVNNKIHDVDRIDNDSILVADIAYDTVYILNTTSNIVEWQWQAQQTFPLDGGGEYPADWTHINDVEQLPDDRIMASLRNQDQVVFIDRTAGIQENWTLGAENAHDVLYEQHNPDFIPESFGGPAVLVADSQNNRVVEYRRVGDEWVLDWEWSDPPLKWPRDADRLPNGHTLIVDTNGERVIEVDESGDIVWEVDARMYDAERLNTGDESSGGPSATRANLRSRKASNAFVESEASFLESIRIRVLSPVPPKILNAARFVTPGWFGLYELLSVLIGVLTGSVWAVAEIRWRYEIAYNRPIRITRRER